MTDNVPQQVDLGDVEPVQLYDFKQRVLFAPAMAGVGFIKFAVTTGRKGARSVLHSHPRDEVTLTWRGEAVLRAGGREYMMRQGSAMRLPSGVEHEVEVLSDERQVVAAYCDECPLCRGPTGAFLA